MPQNDKVFTNQFDDKELMFYVYDYNIKLRQASVGQCDQSFKNLEFIHFMKDEIHCSFYSNAWKIMDYFIILVEHIKLRVYIYDPFLKYIIINTYYKKKGAINLYL